MKLWEPTLALPPFPPGRVDPDIPSTSLQSFSPLRCCCCAESLGLEKFTRDFLNVALQKQLSNLNVRRHQPILDRDRRHGTQFVGDERKGKGLSQNGGEG